MKNINNKEVEDPGIPGLYRVKMPKEEQKEHKELTDFI